MNKEEAVRMESKKTTISLMDTKAVMMKLNRLEKMIDKANTRLYHLEKKVDIIVDTVTKE